MQTLIDISKRTLYMSLFFIAIPLIAYMIHNGSSAVVALVSYFVLSLIIPGGYVSSKISTFGPQKKRISVITYLLGWCIVHVLAYSSVFFKVDLSLLWGWPTIGRDVVFALGMYIQVTVALAVAYALSRIVGVGNE